LWITEWWLSTLLYSSAKERVFTRQAANRNLHAQPKREWQV
jgi:hypothetical protein